MNEFSVKELRVQFTNLWKNRSGLQYMWNLVLSLVNPAYNLSVNKDFVLGKRDALSNLDYNMLRNIRSVYHNRGAVNSSLLSSYLHSNLTNPHAEWMRLSVPESYFLQDRDLSDDVLQNLQFMQLIGQECHNTWQSSNFHSTMFGFYKSLVDIGTACLFRGYYKYPRGNIEPIFRNISMFNVFFMEDAYGRPSHVFVVHSWTAFQIVRYFFPNKSEVELRQLLPKTIVDCYHQRDPMVFSVLQSIYSVDLGNEKVISCYFLYDESSDSSSSEPLMKNEFLRKETLRYNPYCIARIRKPPESGYGVGFSQEAFPLLVNLQNVQKAIWIANDKNVKPPLNIPTNRVANQYSTDPGVLNPMSIVGGKLVGTSPAMNPLDVTPMEQTKMSILDDIDSTYMIDRILMENVRYNRTRAEVQKRTGEEIKILSPFIGSLENEFLRPLVDFTIQMFAMKKDTIVQQAIRHLDNRSFRLQYISPIAQVQVQKQIQNYLEFYGYSNALSQKEKRIDMRIDWLAFWIKLAILSNAPFDTIKNLRDYQKSIGDYEEQMSQMRKDQMMQQVPGFGQTIKNLEEANAIRNKAA